MKRPSRSMRPANWNSHFGMAQTPSAPPTRPRCTIAWPRASRRLTRAKPPSWPSRSPLSPAAACRLHVSVNDPKGANIFAAAAAEGAPALRQAVGGLKALLAESMAIFAPNANSYRRFRPNSYAPVAPTWGINNRTVSLRVPAGPHLPNRHIEHRVAGADANPYLALAALLAGVHHGLTHRLDPGPPVEGDGYAAAAASSERLPAHWYAAVDLFAGSRPWRTRPGGRLRLVAVVKRANRDRFNSGWSPASTTTGI